MGTSKDTDIKDLIGKTIEVFADIDGNEVKEVLVTDVYINSNEDADYLDDLTRFKNGTSKLPSNDENELVSTDVYFLAPS